MDTIPYEELMFLGYRPGAPSYEAAEIDMQVISDTKCPECDHVGMEYRPYHTKNSYRAFAVCPQCNFALEY